MGLSTVAHDKAPAAAGLLAHFNAQLAQLLEHIESWIATPLYAGK